MKIVEHNDRCLQITDRNRQCIWGLLFATPFLAIGLGVGIATVKITTLECKRDRDDRWINSLWSGNFTIAGLICTSIALAIPRQVNCRFESDLDRIIVDKKYLLYGDRQTVLKLSTLDRVDLRKLPFIWNRQHLYNIVLIPAIGKPVSLSVPSANLPFYQQIADTSNDFFKNLE